MNLFSFSPFFQGQQFSNMVFATIHSPIVGGPSQDQHQQITYESVSVEIPQVDYQKPKTTCQYFCVGTLEELEEKIRKHSEETFSHFVVAKKTKGFGAIGDVFHILLILHFL